jgi:hypothetical protein
LRARNLREAPDPFESARFCRGRPA